MIVDIMNTSDAVRKLEEITEKAFNRILNDLKGDCEGLKNIQIGDAFSLSAPWIEIKNRSNSTIAYVMPLDNIAIVKPKIGKSGDPKILIELLNKKGYKIERLIKMYRYVETYKKNGLHIIGYETMLKNVKELEELNQDSSQDCVTCLRSLYE